LLGQHFDVDPRHVHAYVVGEHGNSEVLTWSQTTLAGLSLDEFSRVHGTPLAEEKPAKDRRERSTCRLSHHCRERCDRAQEALRRSAAILRDATASFGV
jgi:hypothetical protein